MRLHALYSGNHDYRAIDRAQRAFDFAREIDMTGRIDDIYHIIAPGERGYSRAHRDAAPAFDIQPVCLRGAVIDAAGRADNARAVKQPLGQRGFTRIDMRQYCQIDDF